MLETLGIGESTPLDVRVEDGKIVVSPLDESEEREESRKMLRVICDKYEGAFKRLAD